MSRSCCALLLLLLIGDVAPAQTPLAPQAGVLMLRNGQVLEGEVTRAGDYYVVTKGEGSELRLKADEAEAFCASLGEAYEFKARHITGETIKSRLDLAQWCLRHHLLEACGEQLALARRTDAENAQLKQLETRLALAAESPPPAGAAASPAATVSAEELENALHSLPKASVEKFGAVVQPILLNRCGANQCHGPNSQSEFRLLRPPQGQIVSRRYTQRNLYATLKFLDSANPAASPLVVMPQQRHGNSLAAVFDKQSVGQLAELIAWARLTVGQPQAAVQTAPTTIAPAATTLSQPAVATPPPTQAVPSAAVDVRVMRPPLDENAGNSPVAAPTRPALRDRFDPEIFNRRYHGKP
jgi:hypothetical protein